MATIKANGLDVFYTEQGSGDETIVFGHGLLMDTTMWDAVAPRFANHYRVICFDFRGQGRTSDPGQGYEIDNLVHDTAAFIQAVSTKPVHYVGLSMGGMVGLPLAARHPDLLRSLVLLDTSAQAEPLWNRIKYAIMTVIVNLFGPRPLIPVMLPLIFGKSSLANPANREVISYWKQKLLALEKTIVGPVYGVTQRRDVSNELPKITCPTLVVVGDEDRATPLSCANNIAAHVANVELKIIAQCGHSSALEKPEEVLALMQRFYSRLS